MTWLNHWDQSKLKKEHQMRNETSDCFLESSRSILAQNLKFDLSKWLSVPWLSGPLGMHLNMQILKLLNSEILSLLERKEKIANEIGQSFSTFYNDSWVKPGALEEFSDTNAYAFQLIQYESQNLKFQGAWELVYVSSFWKIPRMIYKIEMLQENLGCWFYFWII